MCNQFAEIANQNAPHRAAYNLIYEALMNVYPTELKRPDKKVYVSRISSSDDKSELTKRIIDEKKLQDYFVSIGYETHYRENLEEVDLIEDILYFRDVKTIAGISGAGLTNALFMQPGGNVIEISTPQITATKYDNAGFPEKHIRARHLFHPVLSFEKNHMFYQVPIHNKNAEEAINKLKNMGVEQLT
jgi:capsular polysaccharide biosynthesis protein